MKIFIRGLIIILFLITNKSFTQSRKIEQVYKTEKFSESGFDLDSLIKSFNLTKKTIDNNILLVDSVGLIDSIVFVSTDNNKYKYVYEYNELNQRVVQVKMKWQNSHWSIITRILNIYDTFGHLISSIDESLNGSSWIPNSKFESAYNDKNKILFFNQYIMENEWKVIYSENYNYSPEGNIIKYKTDNYFYEAETHEYKYDAQSRVIEHTKHVQLYDGSQEIIKKTNYEFETELYLKIATDLIWNNNSWVNSSRTLYLYELDNLKKNITQNYDDSLWVNLKQFTEEYDDKDNEIYYSIENWQDSIWVNELQITNSYNENGKPLSQIQEIWEGGTWFVSWHSDYHYNENNKLISYERFSFLGSTIFKYEILMEYNSRVNEVYSKYSYWENDELSYTNTTINIHDSKNRVVSSKRFEWYIEGFEEIYKEYTYYNDAEEILKRDDQFNSEKYYLLQNYPNPFNPKTTISFVLPQSSIVRIDLFSILGERVSTISEKWFPEGYNIVRFNSSGLSSGTYIYRLESEGIAISKKMIILK